MSDEGTETPRRPWVDRPLKCEACAERQPERKGAGITYRAVRRHRTVPLVRRGAEGSMNWLERIVGRLSIRPHAFSPKASDQRVTPRLSRSTASTAMPGGSGAAHYAFEHCPGCGVEHHWLTCPEVSQSVFPHDPEWDAEEPPPPMVANRGPWGFSTADPDWRPTRGLVGPRWDPLNPE